MVNRCETVEIAVNLVRRAIMPTNVSFSSNLKTVKEMLVETMDNMIKLNVRSMTFYPLIEIILNGKMKVNSIILDGLTLITIDETENDHEKIILI